jgi:hypothetical protein
MNINMNVNILNMNMDNKNMNYRNMSFMEYEQHVKEKKVIVTKFVLISISMSTVRNIYLSATGMLLEY